MTNYIQTIQTLEKENQNHKTELAKIEERLKVTKEEKEKIIVSLKEKGIKEEDLDKTISTLEEKLQTKIDEIEKELE